MRGAPSRGPAVVRGDCHPLVWGGDLGETVRGQRCFGIGVGVSACNTNTSEPETGFMSASCTRVSRHGAFCRTIELNMRDVALVVHPPPTEFERLLTPCKM